MAMKGSQDIEALLTKAKKIKLDLDQHYKMALEKQNLGSEVKVEIKNIFENLRSCLDYIGHELFEKYCTGHVKPRLLYFPIRTSNADFIGTVNSHYPGLATNCKAAFDLLEAIQPYNDSWLGQFNILNNENKHQALVEQIRTEARHVSVKSRSGSGGVSWGPGVTFGGGVRIMGVSIDPKTQLPIENTTVETSVVIWVDFQFADVRVSALPFIETSILKVEQLFKNLSLYF